MSKVKFCIVGIVKENGKWCEKRVSKFFDTKYAVYKAMHNSEFESCFNPCVRAKKQIQLLNSLEFDIMAT